VIADGKIVLGRISIGAGATIGVNAVVLPGTEVGERALLVGGSILPAGTTIPPGETWRGNPARKWQ
jgi:acetyltransferase-like isoleucine patch superfamily enzyme